MHRCVFWELNAGGIAFLSERQWMLFFGKVNVFLEMVNVFLEMVNVFLEMVNVFLELVYVFLEKQMCTIKL